MKRYGVEGRCLWLGRAASTTLVDPSRDQERLAETIPGETSPYKPLEKILVADQRVPSRLKARLSRSTVQPKRKP